MFANILLPVDLGHDSSWIRALPAAAELARRDGATLHLLAVAPDFGMTAVAGYFPAGFQQDAVARLNADLAAFAAANGPKDVATKAHVGLGHAAEQILAAASATKADLIVMASHAPDMVRSLLIGSVADRVVHASPVSVLVVR
ncbi:universal stress protein [Rubrimonas cliftonensis]|uniref:Nucleotide-binding universal stress protein, UspA family n=1 Tax=Rubrimonas cliftonensis TaxID=89524 RepID=A0A1H3WZD6_9RHOB|nr:universal stress protein [Rubrimonas cliftonensis]SDZ91628.1 Nucleotide-binding universal stress protein, UspA family [Rubrimonas cliftonensis]